MDEKEKTMLEKLADLLPDMPANEVQYLAGYIDALTDKRQLAAAG